jgi:hypothetical protein
MATEANEKHNANAPGPTDVTDFGIATFVSDLRKPKAWNPIDVTECGIVTNVSESHP